MNQLYDLDNKTPKLETKKFGEVGVGEFIRWNSKIYFVLGFGGKNSARPVMEDKKTYRVESQAEILPETEIDTMDRSALGIEVRLRPIN